MTYAHASTGMRSLSEFFTLWHSDDKGDYLEVILAHQRLVYVYPKLAWRKGEHHDHGY